MAGAGLIVATTHDNKIKFLVLSFKEKESLKYDFPKGVIDDGESIEEAAYREAFEEANINRQTLEIISEDWYTPLASKQLYLKLVYMDFKEFKNIRIKRNPHTNIFEHSGLDLVTAEKGEEKLLYYLRGSLIWAEEKYKQYARKTK